MRTSLIHPSFGDQVLKVREDYVSEHPDGQIADTIGLMQGYVREDCQAPAVMRDALEAMGTPDWSQLPQRERVSRVFYYVKGKVRFVGDELLAAGTGMEESGPPVVEVLIRPRDMAVLCDKTACQRMGDCDDFAMYTAALLSALGVKCAFVTVAADESQPQLFSHVYVAAYTDEGERIPLDTSHGPEPGWETERSTRIQEWPIEGAVSTTFLVAGLVLAYLLMRGV